MIELELLGVNGDSVVLTDAQGQRFTLVIDDALRSAVRRDRVSVPIPTPEAAANMSPKQMQVLMRAGASAQEVSDLTGFPLARVQTYEAPIIAERNWAVNRAQKCHIGWGKDSPLLGELVLDRLATRGVDPELVTWDAVRENRDPWQIMVTFVQGAEEKQASWSYDLHTNSVRALDEEARWLTENVASARPQVFDQDSKAPGANANPKAVTIEPIVVEDTSTEALVAELNAQRGQPQRMDLSEFADEDFTGSIPTVSDETGQIVPFGRSETDPQTHSAPEAISGAEALRQDLKETVSHSLPSTDADSEVYLPTSTIAITKQDSMVRRSLEASEARSRSKGRQSVPPWHEIMFGAKPE